MVLAALILSVSPPLFLKWSGGDDGALADFAFRSSNLNICLIRDPQRRWPEMKFEYRTAVDLAQSIARKSNMRVVEAASSLTWRGPYPPTFFGKSQRVTVYDRVLADKSPAQRTKWPLDWLETDLPYQSIEQIQGFFSEHSLKHHWFFDHIKLDFRARHLSERAMVDLLGAALGAKLLVKPHSYFLDIDPGELRSRAVDGFLEAAKRADSAVARANALFLAEEYRTLTDDQLRTMYSAPDARIVLEIKPFTALFLAARNKLEARLAGMNAEQREIFAKIDPEAPTAALCQPDGVDRLRLQGYDRNFFLVL